MNIRPMLRNGSVLALALALALTQPTLAQTANVSGFGPAYQGGGAAPNITGTGCLTGVSTVIQKGDGANGCTPAVQGTDYQPATLATAVAHQFVTSIAVSGATTLAQPGVADLSGLGTGVGTALGVNIGSAGAPVVLNGALGTPSSGTLTNATGLPLTTGVTGLLPVANGGTGTASPGIVAGTNVTITGTWPNQTVNSTGGGGGSLTVTDGTHSVASTTTLTTGTGFVVGGSAGSATVNLAAPNRTSTISTTVVAGDMSGQVNMNGSSLTLTIPAISSTVFPAGATLVVNNLNASAVSISSTPTINGCPATPIYQFGWVALTSNGTSLDCVSFVGFGGISGDISATANAALTVNKIGGKAITLGTLTDGDACTYTASGTVLNCNTVIGGGGNVSAAGTLTNHALVLGQGAQSVAVVGSLGTTTTVLHGNAAGDPTFGAVTLGDHATQAANTVIANVTAGTATPTAASLPSCTDTTGNHLNYTNGTGFSCGTSAPANHHTASIGWVATVNPLNAGILVLPDNSTLVSIVGNVETATGSAATVSVNVASSGTACSAGTTVHSGSFNANGTAATNQTLTLTTTAVTAGQRLCLQTTGTTAWTGGTGVGTLTVTYTSP